MLTKIRAYVIRSIHRLAMQILLKMIRSPLVFQRMRVFNSNNYVFHVDMYLSNLHERQNGLISKVI